MNIKKTMVIAGTVATVGLTGVGGLGVASAATNSASSDKSSSLVDKIAAKFNLNKDDVQDVFDAERTSRQAERQQQTEEQLTQAVTDGKITEAQKATIIAKQTALKADMEAARDSMKDKTADERRSLMQQQRSELEQWAKDNNIPTDYMRYVFGGDHGPGDHRGKPPVDDSVN